MDAQEFTDRVFQALASRPRRRMLDLVRDMPGCSVSQLLEHFDMSRIAVMKHLQVLVDAHLIISRKRGRTRELFFNAAPIQMIYDRWTDEYSAFWASQAVDLKYKVEQRSAGGENRKSRRRDSGASPGDQRRSNSRGKS